jgi:hypothetical protein
MSISNVLEDIQNGAYAKEVVFAREQLQQGNKAAYNHIKSQLPAVTL